MDILAPDHVNFDHLIQIDKNIQPYIKNMKMILSNGIEILINDSFKCAIEIHSQLPHLSFPLSQWLAYIPAAQEKKAIFQILSQTSVDNLPDFIHNIVNVAPMKLLPDTHPFTISYFLSDTAQKIISKKMNYSDFQHLLINSFAKNLHNYKGKMATFAFAELFKIAPLILPEHKDLFQQISDKHIQDFFHHVFRNDYVYSVFDDKNKSFFTYFSIDLFSYLTSDKSNYIIDKFIEKCVLIDPLKNNDFLTLFPEEIITIQTLKKQHDFLVLDSQIVKKNIKSTIKKI